MQYCCLVEDALEKGFSSQLVRSTFTNRLSRINATRLDRYHPYLAIALRAFKMSIVIKALHICIITAFSLVPSSTHFADLYGTRSYRTAIVISSSTGNDVRSHISCISLLPIPVAYGNAHGNCPRSGILQQIVICSFLSHFCATRNTAVRP